MTFEELWIQYEPMVYKIMRQLNIYTINEEWLQIARIALWEAHERFDEKKGTFLNYAYTYVKGKLLVELNKLTKLKQLPPLEEDVSIIDFDTEIIIEHYLSVLNDNEKIWLKDTFYAQLSIYEIAKKHHVHPSTVKYWRKCAREKITNIL